jgi:hypothetical protein
MHLIRNYADQRFDPVFHVMQWVAVSNIIKGPIFPRLSNDRETIMIAERLVPFPKFGVEMYVDSSRKSVHMSYDELRERVCLRVFRTIESFTLRTAAHAAEQNERPLEV